MCPAEAAHQREGTDRVDALQTELDTARTELAIVQQNLDKANTDKHNVGGSASTAPDAAPRLPA